MMDFLKNLGLVTYQNQTLNELQAAGKVELEKVKVLNATTVNGQLEANNSEFSSLTVHGEAVLKTCKIRESAALSGHLLAKDTSFLGNVVINSTRATLDRCTVQGDVIMQGDREPRILILSNDTRIEGRIIGATVQQNNSPHNNL